MQALYRADHTAGDLCSGISGGLSREIVGESVKDDGFAKYLTKGKAVCQKPGKGVAVCAEQERQVSGMSRMRGVFGVIVGQRIGKEVGLVSCTGASLMDVEAKETGFCFRQTVDFRSNQDALFGYIKPYRSTESWVKRITPELCDGIRFSLEQVG